MTTANRLSKGTLAWAGRYAVALELSRRGVVGQIKRVQKRTVILVERQAGTVTIQVNSKQGTEWPGVHGLSGPSEILVLVDFEGKSIAERPDCYIIDFREWKTLLRRECKKWQAKYPDMYIDDTWTLIYPDITTGQQLYRGVGIKPRLVDQFKDKWETITSGCLMSDRMFE